MLQTHETPAAAPLKAVAQSAPAKAVAQSAPVRAAARSAPVKSAAKAATAVKSEVQKAVAAPKQAVAKVRCCIELITTAANTECRR
jgi:hypothetical protein